MNPCRTAILRAQEFTRKFDFYLKLDVRKFFDSVDHNMLKGLLKKKFKDRALLGLLNTIIDHPVPWPKPGKGLPIGNLTSQHFANFYLNQADHFIKDEMGIKGYLRYMDDMVMFGNNKYYLWQAFGDLESFLDHRLGLRVKKGSVNLSPVTEGMSFLGFRVFPGILRLDRRTWQRFRHKFMKIQGAVENGMMDDVLWLRSSAALVGHIMHADSRNLRALFFDNSSRLDF